MWVLLIGAAADLDEATVDWTAIPVGREGAIDEVEGELTMCCD